MFVVLACVLAGPLASRAWADDPRIEAKAHYQAGVKMYSSGDYRGAIKEFTAAQALAPADLNNYNLALCYDKLGEAEPAIQYYRAFLDKSPSSDKRGEIEASVQRLNAALQSAGKKADDARKADEARKIDEARKAEEARRADEARQNEQRRTFDSGAGAGAGAGVGAGAGAAVGAGPGTSVGRAPTGDAQLDRVQQIDVNAVRDQNRMGGAPGPATAAPPAGGNAMGAAPPPGGNAMGAAPTNGGPAVAAPPPANGTAATGPGIPDGKDVKKEDPVYKKWWFWAVVAVSGYVVYSIATESSHSSNTARVQPTARLDQGGMTLLRW